MSQRVEVEVRAWCHDCDWTSEGPKADLDARNHEKAAKHATVVAARPVWKREERP